MVGKIELLNFFQALIIYVTPLYTRRYSLDMIIHPKYVRLLITAITVIVLSLYHSQGQLYNISNLVILQLGRHFSLRKLTTLQ